MHFNHIILQLRKLQWHIINAQRKDRSANLKASLQIQETKGETDIDHWNSSREKS